MTASQPKLGDNMLQDDTIGVSCRWEKDYPPEVALILKHKAIMDGWGDVLEKELIPNQDKYLVVKMYDIEREHDWNSTEYQVRFVCSFAETQHIRVATIDEFPTSIVFRSAIDEIKHRIKNKIKKIFKHEAT